MLFLHFFFGTTCLIGEWIANLKFFRDQNCKGSLPKHCDSGISRADQLNDAYVMLLAYLMYLMLMSSLRNYFVIELSITSASCLSVNDCQCQKISDKLTQPKKSLVIFWWQLSYLATATGRLESVAQYSKENLHSSPQFGIGELGLVTQAILHTPSRLGVWGRKVSDVSCK